MLVTAKVTVDIDPKKYREEYDVTAAETAAHVRKEIQEYADDVVKRHVYKKLGIGHHDAQEAYLAAHSSVFETQTDPDA